MMQGEENIKVAKYQKVFSVWSHLQTKHKKSLSVKGNFQKNDFVFVLKNNHTKNTLWNLVTFKKSEFPKHYVYYFEYRWWKNRVSGLGSLNSNIWAVHHMVSPFSEFRIFVPITIGFQILIETLVSSCKLKIWDLESGIGEIMWWTAYWVPPISYVISLPERKQNI